MKEMPNSGEKGQAVEDGRHAGERLKPVEENIGAEMKRGSAVPLREGTARKSAGVRAALLALNCYKAYVSPFFAGSCRYQPTCSRYAYEAIERFGVARGAWLGLKRLLRCHPLSRRFGYDPVPEKWEEMRGNSFDNCAESNGCEDRRFRCEVRS